MDVLVMERYSSMKSPMAGLRRIGVYPAIACVLRARGQAGDSGSAIALKARMHDA